MKKLLFILVCILSAQFTYAQEIDEIVSKHIEAIGGIDNWKKIQCLNMEATMKVEGAEIKLNRKQVHNACMRMDISVMGMTGYQILTNTEGWSYMPFQGQTKAEPLTKDDIESSQDELSLLDEFVTYKEEGKKLALIGKDDYEGTACYKLAMTDKKGETTHYWIDAKSYLTLKETKKVKANGKEVETTTVYGNYKKNPETGIMYPYSIESDFGEIEVTNISFNTGLKSDDKIFKPSN